MLYFEWDSNKAAVNKKNHGLTFDEASTAFRDPMSLTIYDPLHSEDEDRFILVGNSVKNRLIVAVFTERGDYIRIVSARKATKTERTYYEKNVK
jgi:uncharacterized protein